MNNRYCSAQINGRVVELSNGMLKINWIRQADEYSARTGGGIWFNSKEHWVKIAELAEGEYCTIDRTRLKNLGMFDVDLALPDHTSPSPYADIQKKIKNGIEIGISFGQPNTAKVVKNTSEESVVELTGNITDITGVTWSVFEEWKIKAGDNKFHWSFRFKPDTLPSKNCMLNIRFNVFPHTCRTTTLPSYCGFRDDYLYAVYPDKEDPWWMRLEGAKQKRCIQLPFTYKPTKMSEGMNTVTISGFFLTDNYSPSQLLFTIHDYFDPVPDHQIKNLKKMADAAFVCINRNYTEALKSGFFAEDEGALFGIALKDRFFHHHMGGRSSAFDIGFSVGWSTQAISPLLEYSREYKNNNAEKIALSIANWITRNAQTDYGAYHENYDIILKEGADFIDEDRVYIHTTARNASELLKAFSLTSNREYLDSALRACDWLKNVQEQSGAMPWCLVDSTGGADGSDSYGAVSAEAITAWCLAFKITNNKTYLDSAIRCADYTIDEYILNNNYGSFVTDDRPSNGMNRWECHSPTAVCWVIDGMLELYQTIKDERYLDAARDAGYFLLLYQWPWEIPENQQKNKIKGTTQASSGCGYAIDQTFGSELPLEIEALLSLYEVTGEVFWKNALDLAIDRLMDSQYTEIHDMRYGAIPEGWSLNKDVQLPGPTGNILFTTRIPSIVLRYMKLKPSEK